MLEPCCTKPPNFELNHENPLLKHSINDHSFKIVNKLKVVVVRPQSQEVL